MAGIVLWFFLMVLCDGMQRVIEVFSGHIHLPVGSSLVSTQIICFPVTWSNQNYISK